MKLCHILMAIQLTGESEVAMLESVKNMDI